MATVIGDSLGVGVSKYFKGRHDVKVGRNSGESLLALRKRKVGKRVVLEVGSNDPSAQVLAHNLRQAQKQFKGKHVVVGLVGPGVVDAAAKNKVLKQFAARTGGAVARPGRTSDGVHPEDYRKAARQIKRKFRSSRTEGPRKVRSSTASARPAYGQYARPATSLREMLARGYSGR